MRDTDGLKTTLTLGPVNRQGSDLSVGLELQTTLPLPRQDHDLPDRIESAVHRAGLEVQRRLFRALIEKADRELVLSLRHGKAGRGIQRRGFRPFTFKAIFGEVTVDRSRISHNHAGTIVTPSASAWGTPHQLAITRNLRDAACDRMRDQSGGKSRSTIIEIIHREGGRLVAAQPQRAEAVLDDVPEAQRVRLGVPATEVIAE